MTNKKRLWSITEVLTIIIPLVIGIVTFLAIKYLAAIAISIHSGGFWWTVFAAVAISTVVFFLTAMIREADYEGIGTAMIVTLMVIAVAALVAGLTGAKAFNAERYKNLIEVEEGNFAEEIPQTDTVPYVDLASARKIGSRTIGSLKNSTWYEIDNEYNLIDYKGQKVRISPLNYGDLFKFNKAKHTGIPGYVIVDATSQEGKFVELEKPMYYSPSAYWSKDLKRHLRTVIPGKLLGKSYFEIDDEGNPYWITAIKDTTIGCFGGRIESRFAVTDAVTGKIEIYEAKDLPNWIDHAFELDWLMDVTACHYKYVHGWKNSFIGKTDVKNLSYYYKIISSGSSDDAKGTFTGYNSTISKDGIVFFTGVTPANASESNLGFVLLNTRTGVVKYYECPGAEESSAMKAAEGLVQNLQYAATYPTIINLDGIETYFMLLKDDAGLIQKFALCNVANYTKVVEANSLEEAIGKYKQVLGVETESQETAPADTLKGKIEEIRTAEISGYTYYYFKFENDDNIYMSSIQNSNKQVFLKAGQTISIDFTDSSESGVKLVKKIIF